jgi:predicted Zn-dependent protease
MPSLSLRQGSDWEDTASLPSSAEAQQQILRLTQEYLDLFFDVPVQVRRRVSLAEIPAEARRRHPDWGDDQLLSTYVLRRLLEPDRPDDALAYLALTASDLWPGKGWNFVFGQANLRQRVGVWSIYRNGDPTDPACLRRTLMTASHETGHILTLKHCNGSHDPRAQHGTGQSSAKHPPVETLCKQRRQKHSSGCSSADGAGQIHDRACVRVAKQHEQHLREGEYDEVPGPEDLWQCCLADTDAKPHSSSS